MNTWNRFPFLRFTIFFILGLLWAYYFSPSSAFSLALCLASFISFAIILILVKGGSSFKSGILAILLCLFAFGLAGTWLHHSDQRQDPHHIIHTQEPIEAWQGVITGYVEERSSGFRATVKIEAFRTSEQWQSGCGKVLVFFPYNEEMAWPFQYGQRILFYGTPQLIKGSQNPEEFDYRKYMALQQVHHQFFAKPGQLHIIEQTTPNPFLAIAYRLRDFYAARLIDFIPDKQALAIAKALLLGIKDGLDQELKQAFSAAGAMHILAVSGLHVGILFLVFSGLFSFLRKQGIKAGKPIFIVMVLSCLWLYALLAGASASVLRATVMFSLVLITKELSRHHNIYNTLSIAALVLLLYDPFLLFSVGFQLSFLAVIGIVYLQPGIKSLLQVEGRFLGYLWEITAVSIAAQLATFPLGVLYFHQFPNLFLLANLFVIPGAFAVLFGGAAFFLLSWIPTIASLLGTALYWLIAAINALVFKIEQVPLSALKGLYMDEVQILLLYVLIVVMALGWGQRELKFFRLGGWIALSLGIYSILSFQHRIATSRLVFYSIPGYSYVEIMAGGFYTPLRFDTLPGAKADFHLKQHRMKHAPFGMTPARPLEQELLFVWDGNIFFFLHHDTLTVPQQGKVDYLILGADKVKSLRSLPEEFKFDNLVIDGTNSWPIANRLKKEAADSGIRYHSLLHDGALILTNDAGKNGNKGQNRLYHAE